MNIPLLKLPGAPRSAKPHRKPQPRKRLRKQHGKPMPTRPDLLPLERARKRQELIWPAIALVIAVLVGLALTHT